MLINRLRFDRAYRRLEDEEGLSLVELMVSLIIVGAVLSALASTLVASLRAITKNQREARAIALQTEMVERFQAIPWGDVGLKPEDDGKHPWDKDDNRLDDVLGNDPSADPHDQMPVVLVDDANAERFLPDAIEKRGEGDFEYTIETHVVWVSRDAETPSSLEDYESKRIVVIVRWPDVNGVQREIQIAAERSPPPTAIGFVDSADDADGDNIADSNDNCPHTPNTDQTNSSKPQVEVDSFTPPGVGDACDRDDDGYPEEDRNGDGSLDDPCPNDATNTCTTSTSSPVINSFVVNKQTGDSSYASQDRICVSNNDATSADHRVRVSVSNLGPDSNGTVVIRYSYWKGSENGSPPPNTSGDIPATFTSGTSSQAFYDAVIPKNTGKFRPDLSTGVEVYVSKAQDSGDPLTASDDNNYTLAIDLC